MGHGPAVREVVEPAGRENRLERAIGAEVRRIRRTSGATLAEMALRTGLSKPMLSKIENARTSCSLTTLARLADALDVPVTSLFRGADTPREAAAHLVTLTERSEEFPLFQHPGTELLYMLEGEMVYGHGESSYPLRPGDALQLDGEGVHGPRELVALPIRFLSVVAYGELGTDADG
ncbi:XRE family transcriptional regulator [Pseudonocardia sp. RS11V-5]|uniref:helix-turn-helix domain-containing protein n=1 Tax=Pseudonocardia terrae TaxID=2905831 RepID=UPI001E35B737|nr:XRE family transcriptional regulator [Pseudonocardia terrae]MCE3552689.1 XRE family transcriptional regulator [Pseudonocardia terrae]